jgi:chaperonin GroES
MRPETVSTHRAAAAVASAAVGSDNSRLPIRMLHDRVLVRIPQEEGERRSTGGILIPSTAQMATRLVWAEALAVGNHVRVIEIGDRVLFHPEDRHEVEVHGEIYLILRERDIHAVAAHRIEPSTGLYL